MSKHNEKQYDPEMTLNQILAICQIVLTVDAEALSDLLNQFSFEEAAGPIIDPTRHRAVMDKTCNARDTVVAVADFHRRIRQIVGAEDERITKTEPAT